MLYSVSNGLQLQKTKHDASFLDFIYVFVLATSSEVFIFKNNKCKAMCVCYIHCSFHNSSYILLVIFVKSDILLDLFYVVPGLVGP